MKNAHRFGAAKAALLRQEERLRRFDPISMATAIIPFLGVIVLSLYTGLETSTRLHANGKPMEYPATKVNDRAIWLSISAKDGKILVTTAGQESFSWSELGPSNKDLKPLQSYLEARARDQVMSTVRIGQITNQSHTAVLAVDQTLTFFHLRPIIYALSQAGFSRYGFETRLVR
jgi:hypothetical protein